MKNSNRKKNFKTENYFRRYQKTFSKIIFQILKTTENIFYILKVLKTPI